jgi:CubicO group peptidase (beta-lactamase class C family)
MLQLMVTDSQKPYFSPGNGFNYLNTNYAMLALLVERLSGQSFAAYVQKNIFDPAGMDNSFIANPTTPMGENVATGHVKRRRGYMPIQLGFLDGVVGDKGVYSSVIDLFRFDCALDDGKLIAPETLEEAFCPGSPNRLYTNYGYGWRMRNEVDKVVHHFGWWRGFRSAYIKDVTHDRTILVLSNHDDMRRYFSPWELLCEYYEAN